MRKVGDRQETRSLKDEEQFRPMWIALAEAVDLLTYAAEQDVARRAIALYQKELGVEA